MRRLDLGDNRMSSGRTYLANVRAGRSSRKLSAEMQLRAQQNHRQEQQANHSDVEANARHVLGKTQLSEESLLGQGDRTIR